MITALYGPTDRKGSACLAVRTASPADPLRPMPTLCRANRAVPSGSTRMAIAMCMVLPAGRVQSGRGLLRVVISSTLLLGRDRISLEGHEDGDG